jgi:hypothetical protein
MCCNAVSTRRINRLQWLSYQEIVDPGVLALFALVEVRLTLSEFVVMVGERQVDAAGMDVHLLPKLVRGHNGAFDMPAGAACTPGTGPVRLTRL